MPDSVSDVRRSFNGCTSLKSRAITDMTGFVYECFMSGTSMDSVTVHAHSDSAMTYYEALLMEPAPRRFCQVDSTQAVGLETIAGVSAVTKMAFTPISVNADMEGLTFKDPSGATITDPSALAEKTFVADPDDRTVWNHVLSSAQGYDLVLCGVIITAVVAIIGVAAIFLIRRH